MISQKESSTEFKNSTGFKMIPVGNKEDYSFITTDIYDPNYRHMELKDMRDKIKELRNMVWELKSIIDSKVVIIDSCEEMYAEDWRET